MSSVPLKVVTFDVIVALCLLVVTAPILLGSAIAPDNDVFSMAEMYAAFDIADVNPNPARFDLKKAEAINAAHMRLIGLEEMTERLEADAGHIEMSFPFFVMKQAPVSGVQSLMDYHATLIGERRDGATEMWVRVAIPVTSLCPCSKQISAYGAHNQRSRVTISANASVVTPENTALA